MVLRQLQQLHDAGRVLELDTEQHFLRPLVRALSMDERQKVVCGV